MIFPVELCSTILSVYLNVVSQYPAKSVYIHQQLLLPRLFIEREAARYG